MDTLSHTHTHTISGSVTETWPFVIKGLFRTFAVRSKVSGRTTESQLLNTQPLVQVWGLLLPGGHTKSVLIHFTAFLSYGCVCWVLLYETTLQNVPNHLYLWNHHVSTWSSICSSSRLHSKSVFSQAASTISRSRVSLKAKVQQRRKLCLS